MKRKRLTYDSWSSITRREFVCRRVSVPGFTGMAGLLRIRGVTRPQYWHVAGKSLVVADAGMAWLSLLPEEGRCCIGAMLDRRGKPVLWYIDMIDGQGVDEDGVPWFDDLYLDLVVKPDGFIHEDDRDELDEALRTGDITPAQHRMALDTADMLRRGLLRDLRGLTRLTREVLARMGD
ncbi:MAG: DUF402 domain-containing protein [Aristaeellaceae bacterium]